MSARSTRREFIRTTTVAGVGLFAGARLLAQTPSRGANERLIVGVVGITGQGGWNLSSVAHHADIGAICDIDEERAAPQRQRFPKAEFFTDFRRLVDRKDLDAVLVATPDHTHAPATLAALRAGKHVYCEKPLTHTVHEARLVAETAKKMKRATQMGTQIHAGDNYRRVVEVIRSGAIGPVEEVHVWDGAVWSGGPYPTSMPAVPGGLHWDLWLGPAPKHPYSPKYHPASWRGYWDFGGGALADMACHYTDLPFWALDLRHPTRIEASGPPVHAESAPDDLTVKYEYPARGPLPALTLTWHNGERRPDLRDRGVPQWGSGVLFIGRKGMLLADYNRYILLPEKEFKDFTPPPKSIPDSIGHHKEWIEACKTGKATTCNFDYSGALTEAVLLGNVSYRSGKALEWDAKAMKIRNAPDAERFLTKEYRKGWEI